MNVCREILKSYRFKQTIKSIHVQWIVVNLILNEILLWQTTSNNNNIWEWDFLWNVHEIVIIHYFIIRKSIDFYWKISEIFWVGCWVVRLWKWIIIKSEIVFCVEDDGSIEWWWIWLKMIWISASINATYHFCIWRGRYWHVPSSSCCNFIIIIIHRWILFVIWAWIWWLTMIEIKWIILNSFVVLFLRWFELRSKQYYEFVRWEVIIWMNREKMLIQFK